MLRFYAMATVFQLYHGVDMMYEMTRRKPEPTLLLTKGIFTLPHHIGTIREKLAFDDAVSYTQLEEMNCSTVKCYCSDRDSKPCP